MHPKGSREAVLASSRRSYAHRAYYFDLLAQGSRCDKETARELDFLEEAFRIHSSRPVKNVFDIACGGGRHMVGLAERGYRCAGCDLSPERVEMARKRAERASVNVVLSVGDATKLPKTRKFDAVLALYILFFLPNDDDVRNCLCRAHSILLPGGVLMCNIINPFTLSKNGVMGFIRLGHRSGESRAKGIRITTTEKVSSFDPVKGVLWTDAKDVIEAPDGRHVFRDRECARLLTYWDMKRYLHDAGFEVVGVYPDWTVKSPGKTRAEQIVFVARRR